MNNIDKRLLVKWLGEDGRYKELLSEIEKGIFDAKNYQQMCQSFVGDTLSDFFCNGFFGSRTFDLNGAKILRVYESIEEDAIKIEVMKFNNEFEYGYFNDGWNSWETVYEHLYEWVNKSD